MVACSPGWCSADGDGKTADKAEAELAAFVQSLGSTEERLARILACADAAWRLNGGTGPDPRLLSAQGLSAPRLRSTGVAGVARQDAWSSGSGALERDACARGKREAERAAGLVEMTWARAAEVCPISGSSFDGFAARLRGVGFLGAWRGKGMAAFAGAVVAVTFVLGVLVTVLVYVFAFRRPPAGQKEIKARGRDIDGCQTAVSWNPSHDGVGARLAQLEQAPRAATQPAGAAEAAADRAEEAAAAGGAKGKGARRGGGAEQAGNMRLLGRPDTFEGVEAK
ncbi:unnamed protein product [Prorocentrum cordatum]|uniref:Uncharacterized protein n=2 Tax=Prorocentrum cordatum TaxID=2364126 RepID=A0ABN9TEN4_9DINO|nr:unnamed protein product [Polarella glacialis]